MTMQADLTTDFSDYTDFPCDNALPTCQPSNPSQPPRQPVHVSSREPRRGSFFYNPGLSGLEEAAKPGGTLPLLLDPGGVASIARRLSQSTRRER